MSMEEMLEEIEAIVYSGTKLNIKYFIEEVVDPDEEFDIYDYFRHAENDIIGKIRIAAFVAFDQFSGHDVIHLDSAVVECKPEAAFAVYQTCRKFSQLLCGLMIFSGHLIDYQDSFWAAANEFPVLQRVHIFDYEVVVLCGDELGQFVFCIRITINISLASQPDVTVIAAETVKTS
jgi:hypothetical protein